MSAPTEQTIREFFQTQIACWNADEKERMFDAYRRIAGKGLKIEYVGGPVLDGWPALEEMWTQYHGAGKTKITIEIVEILVNGNEGACYLRNHVDTPNGPVISPSIETYNFGDGTLHARYFHNSH